MKRAIVLVRLLFSALMLSGHPAYAQMGRGGLNIPQIFGDWNVTIGSGATYSIQSDGKDKPTLFEVAVVGEEKVDGQTGHWVEMRIDSGREGKTTLVKYLFVKLPDEVSIKRAIFKSGSQPAMEMPMGLMGAMGSGMIQKESFNWKNSAKLIGTETITTPAGSFSCQHYQTNDKGEIHDAWISNKVAPYGLIQSKTPKTTMILQKVLSGEKTKITEAPQKLDIPMGPRQR